MAGSTGSNARWALSEQAEDLVEQVGKRIPRRIMAFREESFEVPVRTEDVNVDKVVRVAEQVDIDKQAIQDTKRVKGTVRKERVDVDQSGDVDITATNTKWNGPGLRS